jgi:cytochrome P450 family 4
MICYKYFFRIQGHDTTAAGSSFVLCMLGIHQNIQDKVYNELYEIFGDSDRPATFDDTLRMKYLERVILETLRMYPPVPVIARKLNHDVQICEYIMYNYYSRRIFCRNEP